MGGGPFIDSDPPDDEIYDDQTLQDWLKDVIETNSDNESKKLRVKTYDSVGMLTMNKGLVITLPNGNEYQLNIVRSA